jgi:ABC-2 type transport system ATP-binding protein
MVPIIEVSHVAKSFGATQAVVDVSFAVRRGEIFGLLGPNGAGKTTTIRLMLDILKPDRGAISILDGPMTEAKKDRIGYMPEERGLYQDVTLERCLIHLATLKGLSIPEARRRLEEHLERFDLADHRGKKTKELSKGMQQKAQIINTILHRPELIIIDEPFTSLDPVNTQLVKTVIRELAADGATILMSTHQMHQVEELCDRILLIARGRDLLYGELDQIRRRFSGHAVILQVHGQLPTLPGVAEAAAHNSATRLTLTDDTSPQEVLATLVHSGATVERFEIAVPTLDEIFIRVVEGRTV